jgi:DNA-binding IclR family transcriptional regulator
MTLSNIDRHILRAFLELAQADQQVSVPAVCQRAGVTRAELYQRLAHLDRAGWVDGRRVRLTLPGLAVAAALPATLRMARRAA